MINRFKSAIKIIINKLFNEEHNPLESIGISVNDISKSIAGIKLGDKKDIESIKYDIDFALEFSDVISIQERKELERLNIQLENKKLYDLKKEIDEIIDVQRREIREMKKIIKVIEYYKK